MIKFFAIFANISSWLAIAASLIFYVGIIGRSRHLTNSKTFCNCSAQLQSCRVSSVVFMLLAWFLASGGTRSEAVAGYAALSRTCSRLGYIWVVFAFINILLSLILSIMGRSSSDLEITKELRRPGFIMGAVFLTLSFILQVN
ncbi:MAG: hypothetical protein IKY17_00260 [Oscillospiraceae bacterium]|nr:hypothetical protein [Oscillospiraceae bacterium]